MDTQLIVSLINSPVEEDMSIAVAFIKTEADLVEFLWITNILFFSNIWDNHGLAYYEDVSERIYKITEFPQNMVHKIDTFFGDILNPRHI